MGVVELDLHVDRRCIVKDCTHDATRDGDWPDLCAKHRDHILAKLNPEPANDAAPPVSFSGLAIGTSILPGLGPHPFDRLKGGTGRLFPWTAKVAVASPGSVSLAITAMTRCQPHTLSITPDDIEVTGVYLGVEPLMGPGGMFARDVGHLPLERIAPVMQTAIMLTMQLQVPRPCEVHAVLLAAEV